MQDLQDTARAAGIDVPITHNQCCDASWTPTWASGLGAVQIPGVDDYPQSFECQTPDVWGPWGPGTTERLSETAPVYAAEYQAGAIDLNRAGYEKCRELTGPSYMRYFYKSNLITSGATMFGYYMAFGGTNWGWLGQPNDVYTSYDYGAPITEARQLTDKYAEFKRQGYFVRAVTPLTRTDPAQAPTSSAAEVETLARANPDTGTQFVLVRSLTGATSTLDWSTPDGRYQVPVTVGARDAQVLVAGYDLGGQRLAWSSSELMTHTRAGGRDVAVLYGRAGTEGSTVLRYASRPSVKGLAGSVRSSFAGGDLKLDYRHDGLARVLVTGGGRPPLLLLLGTNETAAEFWQHGSTLVRGTALVRSADVRGRTATVRADTAAPSDIEVFAAASKLVVNGEVVPTRTTASGSLVGRLRGPAPVRLPTLDGWRAQRESVVDDARWTVADRGLAAGTYGYDHGHVWYRGHFTTTGAEASVKLNAITGKNGVYQVWLNDRYLGWANGGTQADSDAPVNQDPGPGTFTLPALPPGTPAVLSVLVENMGHNDNWTADDTRFKQPRGLVQASFTGADTPITWRLRGNVADPVRGPLNNGGLLGERAGWHLPGDRHWGTPPASLEPGVTWYRTEFRMDLPAGQDVPVALRFTGSGPYRTLIYVNGWQLGQFTGDLGPQRDFVLPAGILREHGKNTLAMAVIALEETTPGPVHLVALANHRGGIPVHPG
jgi:hypothetical protein